MPGGGVVTFFEGGVKEGCHWGWSRGCGVHTYMQVVTQQLSPFPFFTRTPLFVLMQMHTCGGGSRPPTRACVHPHGGGSKYIKGKGLARQRKHGIQHHRQRQSARLVGGNPAGIQAERVFGGVRGGVRDDGEWRGGTPISHRSCTPSSPSLKSIRTELQHPLQKRKKKSRLN